MEKLLQSKQAEGILGHRAQQCLWLNKGTVVQKHMDSVKYIFYAEIAQAASFECLWQAGSMLK